MNITELQKLIATTLDDRKYSLRTKEAYITWFNDLCKYHSRKDPAELSELELNEYLKHLRDKRNLSIPTIRIARCALDFVYTKVLDKNYNNLKRYTTKWSARPQISVPSQDVILLIISNIREKDNKLVISTIYALGVELSECLNIRIRDIDLKNRFVRIKLNRNKGTRDVVIPSVLIKEISKIVESKEKNDYLFNRSKNLKSASTKPQKAFSRSMKKLGIKDGYSIRSLRYAYVKHLELLGVPVASTIKHLKLSKSASLEFYSRIGVAEIPITFSPLDRSIGKGEEKRYEIIPYVALTRINELSIIKNSSYDLSRLVEMLAELNLAHKNKAYMTIAMLVRAVIDHIPPALGCNTFNEVTSNYSGSKSFKKAMIHLNNSLRNVADTYLHLRVRNTESLPTFSQVDFKSDLDLLLAEIIRKIK